MLIDNILSQANVDKQQKYRLFLHKMNGELIREITKQSFNFVYSPQLGGCDSISFSIYKKYDNEDVLEYDSIIGGALIKLKQESGDIGYFKIQNPQLENDGISEQKNIKAYSNEISLSYKKIYVTEGTFKIVNDSNPSYGVLNLVIEKAPSWSIGYVEGSLVNKERYLDISDTNTYDLLMNKIQETYECVFIFDTINKIINVYSLDSFGDDSKIILSMQNLLKTASVEEITDEIITKLHIYGDNGLTVREINFGNDYIQNLSYYKNTKFMSQSLIDSLNSYDILISNSTVTYNNYLVSLYSLQGQLVVKESALDILNGELDSLNEQKSYLQSIGESTSSIQSQIYSKNSEISSTNSQISSLESSIVSVNNNINSLLLTISIDNNFTEDQIKEMDNFIREDTYQDSSFVVGETFTYNQIVDVQNDLLDLGKDVLIRASYPKYKIDIDVVDFLKLPEYANWWSELKIGDIVYVTIDDSFTAKVRVVGYTHDWDNNKLSIQLGDKYSFDDSNIQLLDLIKDSISTGTTVNYKSQTWGNWSENSNDVLDFINNSLDLNKNKIIGGTNQEMLFDGSGLLMRSYNSLTSNYEPEQLKITNGAIVLSDDAFETAKLAIGKDSNGNMSVIAEVIAGKILLGNKVIIETDSGDFRVDEDGVNITSMSLNLTSDDNLNNILINPDIGLKIRSRISTSQSFGDSLYFDKITKRLKLSGDLEAGGGTFVGKLSITNGNTSVNIDPSGSDILVIESDGYNILTINDDGDADYGGDISGSYITGSTIVGGIFKTSSSGERIQISNDSFNTYNSSNEKTGIQIESSDNLYELLFTRDSLVKASIIFDDLNTLNISAYSGSSLRLFGSDKVLIRSSSGDVRIEGGADNLYYNDDKIATEYYVRSEISDIPSSTTTVSEGRAIDVSYSSGNYEVSLDRDYTDNRYCQNESSQEMSFQYTSGADLEVFVNGSYVGFITLDT